MKRFDIFWIFILFSFPTSVLVTEATYRNFYDDVDYIEYRKLLDAILLNQYPVSCANQCFFSLSYEHKAGFGSRVHFMITGLALALENRCIFMLAFSNEWSIKSEASPFKTLSKCRCKHKKKERKITRNMLSDAYFRHTPKIRGQKKFSVIAWMTAATTFFMRLTQEYESLVSQIQHDIGWKTKCNGLVTGIHVRHGDKGSEANLQPFSSYLYHLSRWEYLSGSPGLKCIFLSTDDETLLSQLEKQNDIISLPAKKKIYTVRVLRAQHYSKYEDVSEIGKLILDLILLSRAQTLMFTFSSNFGQLAMFLKPTNLVQNLNYGMMPKLIPLDFYHHVKFGHKTYGYFLTRSIRKGGESSRWIIYPIPFQTISGILGCDPRFEGCIYSTRVGENRCCNLYSFAGQESFKNLKVGPNLTQFFLLEKYE